MAITSTTNIKAYRMAVGVFFFIAGFAGSAWASRIPDIKEKLNLSEAALGTILFALPAGQMLSLPLSGWIMSRYGSRRLLIVSAIGFALLLLPLAAVTTGWQLAAALFFFGMAANCLNITMNTQAVGVETLYGKSIMASFHGLWSIACFAGAALGSLFVRSGSSTHIHFTVVALFIALLVLLFYRHTLPNDIHTDDTRPVLGKPDKEIWLLGLIAFCSMMCEGAIADWSGIYFQKVISTPASMTTLGYVAFTGAMACGRLFGDPLIVKVGARRMMMAGGNLMLLGMLMVVALPFPVTGILGFLFVGLGASCIVPIVFSMAGKTSKMSAGMALTIVSTIGFLGLLLGPPLLGYIGQVAGLRWSFVLLAALCLVIIGVGKRTF